MPEHIEYRHRPVQAGGDPSRGIRHAVVCEKCLTLWPCTAQMMDARYAAAELASYQRQHPEPTYAHAANLSAL